MKMLLLTATLLAAALPAPAQQAVPEIPSLWREVTGVIDDPALAPFVHNPYFTRPHIPGFRTTADGRIGVVVEGNSNMRVPSFALMKPEKMNGPFLLEPGSAPGDHSGSYTMSTGVTYLDDMADQNYINQEFAMGKKPSHACIWDAAPPVSVGGKDVYRVYVFVTANEDDVNDDPTTQFFVTEVEITVANPKTANATIESVTKPAGSTTMAGPVFGPLEPAPRNFEAHGFEPVIAGDGGLLVLRIGSNTYTYQHPVTGVTSPPGHDIVYSYYDPTTLGEANPAGWQELLPITYAPDDNAINTKFGFAMAPFRDAAGQPIIPGQELGGSYPWIDRDAKNLFFEGVRDQLRHQDSTGWETTARYPHEQVPGDGWFNPNMGENRNYHQGVSFIGLWSHGKLVQLDNLMNDMDYAIGNGFPGPGNPPEPQQRLVSLYEPGSDPLGVHDGKLVLGYGRSTQYLPPGENDNANIIDSLENKLNANDNFRFLKLQDIVWPMSTGRQTDEFAFDDYLDPDAVIVANMSGLLTWQQGVLVPGSHGSSLKHHTSWDEGIKDWTPGLDPIRLQNGATGTRWNLPAWGEIVGDGRLEPAANGGVHGKGLWLDGDIGLAFDMPAQSGGAGDPVVADSDWYVGVFVDCRFEDDGVDRRLISFPDGTSLQLHGRRQVRYVGANGAVVQRITLPETGTSLPDLMPNFGWAHLGLQVFDAGARVDLHLNGMLFNRWTSPVAGPSLFQMTAGTLTLGKLTGEPELGFEGWTDDLKVFAHTMDLETASNHAGATIIGLPGSYTGTWRSDHAERYPDWVHDEIADTLARLGEDSTGYDTFAPFHDYTADNSVHRASIPAGTDSLRLSLQFPEGPLFHDAPRPDSTTNGFCLSCHHTDGLVGLDVNALAVIPGLDAKDDPRRQPSQPPATLHGEIPLGLVTNTAHPVAQPTTPVATPALVDTLMLEEYLSNAEVVSFTLIDKTSGDEVQELKTGDVIDPARLGADIFQIRANLDHEQGDVSTVLFLGSASIGGTTTKPPHLVPLNTGVSDVPLPPGDYTLVGIGEGQTPAIVTFSVPGDEWRVVADYQEDYREGSPAPGWRYRWSPPGTLTSPADYVDLFWTPTKGHYAVDGLTTPTSEGFGGYANLKPQGGHPGNSPAGLNFLYDAYVAASYTAKAAGDYRIVAGDITISNPSSNGGVVAIFIAKNGVLQQPVPYSSVGASHTLTLPETTLQTGDEIVVVVGAFEDPNFDSFTMDYAIEYRP